MVYPSVLITALLAGTVQGVTGFGGGIITMLTAFLGSFWLMMVILLVKMQHFVGLIFFVKMGLMYWKKFARFLLE